MAEAREHWKPATPVFEKLGRRPKRAIASSYVSQQQRGFAVGVIHSIRVYDGLREPEAAIRAMLFARKMITEDKAQSSSCAKGVRPSAADAADPNPWLDDNIYASNMRPQRKFVGGQHRIWLPDGALANGRSNGWRNIVAREQLIAWVFLWAHPELELRWLGIQIGFGVFTTQSISKGQTLQLQGVADYEMQDPHTTMHLQATASDRACGDTTWDYLAVYGPVVLINAACALHQCVKLKVADMYQGSKEVYAEWKASVGGLDKDRQVLAAYSPPHGECWCCPGLGPKRQCKHLLVGKRNANQSQA